MYKNLDEILKEPEILASLWLCAASKYLLYTFYRKGVKNKDLHRARLNDYLFERTLDQEMIEYFKAQEGNIEETNHLLSDARELTNRFIRSMIFDSDLKYFKRMDKMLGTELYNGFPSNIELKRIKNSLKSKTEKND